jgi:hypothetical protein
MTMLAGLEILEMGAACITLVVVLAHMFIEMIR